ncbi:hypothetical protein [Fluviicola taffensis]|uniref:Uncharacterized protein n=1 Tax=Fluviicola taffensis (strain DSM 16823 / NCIMB 13979 / RW262) TaxID=755732 RepID=F2I940_FLUTR|nr:hypothetical protein [Fluviicola taffensis]AEA42987.1 hypothetical protein Fluta_0986 [Fluviicola taffensis DSM 16823]
MKTADSIDLGQPFFFDKNTIHKFWLLLHKVKLELVKRAYFFAS